MKQRQRRFKIAHHHAEFPEFGCLGEKEICSPILQDNEAAIYVLVDPFDGRVRYVGCTISPHGRMVSHIGDPMACLKPWVNNLLLLDGEPIMRVVDVCPYRDSLFIESEWALRYMQHGDLLNTNLDFTVRKPLATKRRAPTPANHPSSASNHWKWGNIIRKSEIRLTYVSKRAHT